MLSTIWRILVPVSLCIAPACPLFSQVSFFSPPTFQGEGNLIVADFNRDGKPDVLTADGTLQLGIGGGVFTSPTTVPTTGTVAPLLVADFNGDGIPDILEQGTNTFLVLLGNGDGTFQPAISSVNNTNIAALAAANLNGDNYADVVGVSGTSLLVFVSKGDGTFAAPVAYNLGASSTLAVVSPGDFNGDGMTDIAVGISGEEIVFLGNGDGTFKTPGTTSTTGSTIDFAAGGDFNGDGKLDLAVSEPGSVPASSVYILLGNGDGTFGTPVLAFGADGPLVAADVNGDGKLDLLSAIAGFDQIFLGNGDGTFIKSSYYASLDYFFTETPVSGSSVGIAVADFNADGKLDIAAGGGAILLGNGDGTFQGIPTASVPIGSAIVGSFGQNHAPAIAALSGEQLSILGLSGSYALSLIHTYALQHPGSGIVAADFNGDGNVDLAIVGTDSQNQNWNYSVLLGNAAESFQAPMFFSQSGALTGSIAVGDFNNDGKPDLIVGAGGQEQLAVLLGKGDGTFAPPVYSKGFFSFLIADFNGDGNLDIAWSQGGNTIGSQENPTLISYGNGDGTFQSPVTPTSLNSFPGALMADVNNDGKADLIRGFCWDCGDYLALGNGDGTFTLADPIITGGAGAFYTYEIADFNGDGNADYLSSSVNGFPDRTWIGLGGTTDGGGGIPGFAGGGGVPSFVADVNGDGRPDLVYAWSTGLMVLLNTTATGPGFGLFASKPLPASPGSSTASSVGVFPFFGFQSSVNLSCGGLPTGTTCAFNPPTFDSASGLSTLTITTGANTPTGTYPIRVQGGSASFSNSTLLSLVLEPPDFSMEAELGSPTSQTISAGQTASFTLAVTRLGSFRGTVNLSCAITPPVTPAPTCTLSKSSIQIVDSSSQSIMVTVGTTAATTSSVAPFAGFPIGAILPPTWMSIVLGSGLLLLSSRKRRPSLALYLIVVGIVCSIACGGSNSSIHSVTPATPSGKYSVTVTGVEGSLNHNAGFQVVVQ